MPEEPQQPINEDALVARVGESVKTAITDIVREQRTQQAQQQQQAAIQQQWQQDPVGAAVAPYVVPMARELTLRAEAAEDKADFYTSHPEALRYKGKVEELFRKAYDQGRPTSRESLWKFHIGENFDHFAKEREENQRLQAEEAARIGATVGGAFRPGSTTQSDSEFMNLPLEKKREVLFNTPLAQQTF